MVQAPDTPRQLEEGRFCPRQCTLEERRKGRLRTAGLRWVRGRASPWRVMSPARPTRGYTLYTRGCPPPVAQAFLPKILVPERDSLLRFLGEKCGLRDRFQTRTVFWRATPRISRSIPGLRGSRLLIFHLQYSRSPLRCREITVSGMTMASTERQPDDSLDSHTH